MKNIKIKHGKATVGINKEWLKGFKSESEMLEGTKNIMSSIAEPRRTEILKEEYAKVQPKTEAPASSAKADSKNKG